MPDITQLSVKFSVCDCGRRSPLRVCAHLQYWTAQQRRTASGQAFTGAAAMSKRTPTGEQAKCYVCHGRDKKGNLQRCLGWHLVKRLEDDAREYNQLQELAQAQDDELESQRKTMHPAHTQAHQEPDDNVHIDILDMSGGSAFQAAGFDMQDAAGSTGTPRGAAHPSLTLREVPRFQLFSPSTTIFEFAGCPFASTDIMHSSPTALLVEGPQLPHGGVRYFHQTCLHRGEHLRHYRRVLHWSGSSNINPKKKNAGKRDMVKVTGRTALCNDCLNAFSIAINSDPNEMLPKETDPERRQRKVNSRRRQTSGAREAAPLEEAHNMVFSLYVTNNNLFELKETSSFTALRASVPDVNTACVALEHAMRSHLQPEPALEHHCRMKRQREEYEAVGVASQPLPEVGSEAPVDPAITASLDAAFASLESQAASKRLQQLASNFGQHEASHPQDVHRAQHSHLSNEQQPLHVQLPNTDPPQHLHLSDAQQQQLADLSDTQQPQAVELPITDPQQHLHLSDAQQQQQQHSDLSNTQQPQEVPLSDAELPQHLHLSDAQQPQQAELSDTQQVQEVPLSDAELPQHLHLSDAQQPHQLHLSDTASDLPQNFQQAEFVLQ